MKFLAAAFLAMTAFTYAAAPTVDSHIVSDITATTAKLTVTVTVGGAATDVKIKYGVAGTTLDKELTRVLPATPDSQSTVFNLTGLARGQTYDYTIEATNPETSGVIDGTDFDVPAIKPSIGLLTAYVAPDKTYTLAGSITPNGADTQFQFEYGPAGGALGVYGNLAPADFTSIGSGVSATTVRAALSADIVAGIHHYRLRAKNSFGESISSDGVFTVVPNPPIVTSITPGEITNGKAPNFAATVDNTGGLATKATLRYALLGKPILDEESNKLTVNVLNGGANFGQLQNLFIGGQTYEATVEAVNDNGSSGQTPSANIIVPKYQPTVSKPSPSTNPAAGTAELKVTVTPNGEDANVTFDYGRTNTYELASGLQGTPATVPNIVNGEVNAGQVVKVTIGPLLRGIRYFYRVHATSSAPGAPQTPFTAEVTMPANRAPIARDDRATVRDAKPVFIDVLKNDKDPEGDGFSLVLVTQGTQGHAEIVGSQIKYTPRPDAKSGDHFTYTVKDNYTSSPKTAVGKVTIVAPGFESRGLYSAEITDENGDTAGMITLLGSGEGAVTGKVHFYAKTYTVRGTVDENGNFFYTIPRDGDTPLQLNANFTRDDSKNFTAALSSGGDTWNADSTLYELSNARRDEIVGKYTVQLPGGGDTDAPKGTGYARLDVKPWGEVKIVGRFGDGTKFTSKGVLTGTDQAPVVSMWATPKDSRVDAKFNFGSGESPAVTGAMKWYRKPDGDSQFFPNGFYTTGSPSGGRYEPPAENQRALEVNGGDAKTATLTLSDGNLPRSIVQQVTLSQNDKVSYDTKSSDGVTLKIDRGAGTFKGEFDHPFDNTRRKFNGVLVQSASNGKGVFIGIDQTGTAALAIGAAPPPPTTPQQPQQPDPNNPGNNTGGNNTGGNNNGGNINIPGVGNVQIPGNINLGR